MRVDNSAPRGLARGQFRACRLETWTVPGLSSLRACNASPGGLLRSVSASVAWVSSGLGLSLLLRLLLRLRLSHRLPSLVSVSGAAAASELGCLDVAWVQPPPGASYPLPPFPPHPPVATSTDNANVSGGAVVSSLAAIPRRTHRISSDLRSLAAQGPVSTGVGGRPGRPQGAASFFGPPLRRMGAAN